MKTIEQQLDDIEVLIPDPFWRGCIQWGWDSKQPLNPYITQSVSPNGNIRKIFLYEQSEYEDFIENLPLAEALLSESQYVREYRRWFELGLKDIILKNKS